MVASPQWDIHHVISDLSGTTGLAIVDAILAGERDPQKLAQLRDWRIRASEETIMKSLVGDYREEHLFALRQSLKSYRHYQEMIQEVDTQVKQMMQRLPSKVGEGEKPPKEENPRKTPWRNEPPQLRGDLYRTIGVDLTQVPCIKTLLSKAKCAFRNNCSCQRWSMLGANRASSQSFDAGTFSIRCRRNGSVFSSAHHRRRSFFKGLAPRTTFRPDFRQLETISQLPVEPPHEGDARTMLAARGQLRRFAPLPAPLRSGGPGFTTGGSGGNTHGLLAQSNLQNLTHTTASGEDLWTASQGGR